MSGDFCEVSHGPFMFSNPASVSALIDLGERPVLERMDADNRSLSRCPGRGVAI
ncbi:MAG: hypothetical protein WD046_13815 [Paracoccaceae bacterium]